MHATLLTLKQPRLLNIDVLNQWQLLSQSKQTKETPQKCKYSRGTDERKWGAPRTALKDAANA